MSLWLKSLFCYNRLYMKLFTNQEKRFVGTAVLITCCLLFFAFFQQSSQLSSVLQGFIITLVFFLLLPLLYTRLVLGEPLGHLGFRMPNQPVVAFLWLLFASAIGFFVCWGVVYFDPSVVEKIIFPVQVETSFVWFILYALTLLPLVTLIYEVFFRGLVQMLWLSNTWKAVVFQWALFVVLLFLTDGITKTGAPLIASALMAGVVARKTDSLWYAFITSYLIAFLTDVLFLSLR